MFVLQIVLIIVALCGILLWVMEGYRRDDEQEERPTLQTILLAAWIVASAMLGPHFFVFRAAGIFDITIERALFATLMFFLAAGLFTGKVRFQSLTVEIYMVVFALVCIISMMRVGFVPVTPEFVSPWFVFITGYLFPFIIYFFAKNYVVSEKDVLLILHTLFYLGLYLSITAFFEYSNLRQFVFPKYINDPDVSILHLDRARGPFLNAAFNGVGILIGFISGLHLLQKKTGFAGFFYKASLLLYFPAVFFTLTRSVYLGLLITLFIFLRWYKTSYSKWKLLSIPLTLVLIIGIVNSPRLLSSDRREGGVAQVEEVDIRLALLRQSYFMFSENPIKGIGLGQFIPASTLSYKGPVPWVVEQAGTTFQHNHLLGIATELGLPGLLFYLTVIILILRQMKLLAGKLPETGIMGKNLTVAAFTVWCVYLNNNLFVEPSNNIYVNAAPFLFAGLIGGLYARSLPSGEVLQPSMRMITDHV